MRPSGATFWLLDGRTGWRTGFADAVSASAESGLRLAADPTGPLAFGARDDSLGGAVLPQGMALADGLLYLLGPREPWVKRFDPMTRRFVTLPLVGGEGHETRQLHRPANLAVAGRNLYLADRGNRRVQVFSRDTLALLHVWGPSDAPGGPLVPGLREPWDPVDVAAQADTAYVLDGRFGRVYRHRAGTDALVLVVRRHSANEYRWGRIAVDHGGRIYLLDRPASRVDVYDARGRYLETVRDPGDIRGRFDPPALRLVYRRNDPNDEGRFCLPEELVRPCGLRGPERPPSPEQPLALCPPHAGGGLLFDRSGRPARVDPYEPPPADLYGRKGTWISEALDSNIHACAWHRIAMQLAALPPGARVTVRTYTDARRLRPEDVARLPEHLWETGHAVTGAMQPPPGLDTTARRFVGAERRRPPRSGPEPLPVEEFLVQSREGQYLWLRLDLEGDGRGSPLVTALRVHYPRESYLGYLPAIYSADEETRRFLERFLSVFQTEWDALERRIEESSGYFDPRAVPAGALLESLARWLAVPLERTWTAEEQRGLLAAAPKTYPVRGTVEGLRRHLRAYLQKITGLSPEEQGDYPQIVEGFRERQRLLLASGAPARLGQGAPLWSPSFVARLQLGVFAREGEVRLVSTGDPERDLFHEHAHRFRVLVPSAWVRTRADERMLCRVLDAEKPAHTAYALCLVEPRFRVGLQATVGMDTILGDYPVARLACAGRQDTPLGRPPRQCLGYDTVLGGRPRSEGLRPLPGPRLGLDTLLT